MTDDETTVAHGRHRSGGRRRAVVRGYATAVAVVAAVIVVANVLPSVVHSPPTNASAVSFTPAEPPGSPGVTVGGVKCGPGVRQVPWSHYAPLCVPKYTGNNGGATAPGVTATTITLTYREAASIELRELYSIVPESVLGDNAEAISTMQALIKTFNQTFELYGRKVVLKPFVGKGDFVTELTGAGQPGAQADAVTARSLHAFADSSAIAGTPIYEQALASQHVIGFSIFGGPDSMFQQSSPYLYTSGGVCSKSVAQTVQLVGRVLSRTKTSFAGSALNGQTRRFVRLGPTTAQTEQCNNEIASELKARYGITVNPILDISLSSSAVSEANTAIAQIKAHHDTTILCSNCDFFTTIYLTQAADSQNFYPEWIESDFLDALTGLQTRAQRAHIEGFGIQSQPKQQTEAYTAYRMGAGPGSQLIPSFRYVYAPMLLFFDALQAAGPDLTPQTFQKGLRSLPNSIPGGMFGNWSFGPDSFDPNASYSMARWSNTTPSAIDGRPGAWVNCDGGRQFNISGTPPQLPLGKPISCPARS